MIGNAEFWKQCDELHEAVTRLDKSGFLETSIEEIFIEGTQIKIAEIRHVKGELYIWPIDIFQQRVILDKGAKITNVLFD